ncbi:MAG: hypothetical protein ACAH80_05660 [Alphaproteobacteria bacterium]
MKDDSFREQFDKVAKEMGESRRNRMLLRVLEILRSAVQDMQDNGYPVTLDFRLRDSNGPMHLTAEERRQSAVNGSIRFGEGGPPLEFFCQQHYAESVNFKAYIGTQEVISQHAYGEDLVHMQQGILRGLMAVQAEHEMISKFNLGDRNGKAAMIGKSVLPKPPSKP